MLNFYFLCLQGCSIEIRLSLWGAHTLFTNEREREKGRERESEKEGEREKEGGSEKEGGRDVEYGY